MPYYEKISCRIAIQVCTGHFPDGRERHRTFSIRNVNPDAPLEPIEAVVRALALILAYPITKVRKVVKRKIFFYEEAALPAPRGNQGKQGKQKNAGPVSYAERIIPFPAFSVTDRYVSLQALPDVPIRNALPPRLFLSGRAPPSAPAVGSFS